MSNFRFAMALAAWLILGCSHGKDSNSCSATTGMNPQVGPAGDPSECGALGCGPEIHLQADIQMTAKHLNAPIVEICHDESCIVDATLGRKPHIGGAGIRVDGATVKLTPGPVPPDQLHNANPTVPVSLAVSWYGAASKALCIDDRFRITLRDDLGAPFFERRYRVKSQRTFPANGPGCPPMCRTAELEPSGGPPMQGDRAGCQR